MNIEHVNPGDIEAKSFEIITKELLDAGIDIPEDRDFIVKRCIHTSADFDYAKTMYFSEDAVDKVFELIRGGATIVTDTNMALTGINKAECAKHGVSVKCFMADEEVARKAKERGVTRATVSMEEAAGIEGNVIFAVGNAPTALLKLREMIDEKIFVPAFIIAVPVGFVNVEAAKELIIDTDIPCIVNRGRKGGSNIAAAIVNAILYKL